MHVAHLENSTTVRTVQALRPARALRLVRAGLGALAAVSPPLAGRAAGRLFLTPPRPAPPAWEEEALREAEPFALDVGGTTLRGFRRGDGPAVLLVHGWGGRGGQLAALAPPLLAAGASVVGFDGPAHGRSGGQLASLPRLAEAATRVARAFGARAAIGHSFGAAALGLALARGLSLDAVALVAAPRSPALYFERFCADMRLRPAARDAFRRRLEERVGIAMADLEAARVVSALATPALVVHDRDDREVPFEDAIAIAAAWPGARLLATEGLGHRRVLRDPVVAADVARFVVERLARCDGCGRLLGRGAAGERCEGCALAAHLADRAGREPGAAA
jgi:pimeloyl-ACP methyl ester carboxylesterase